jgi:two-component system, sensor histidine kinase and response regulator
LILMDVQMPEMDGLEATARIRAEEQGTGVVHRPIIAMTAHALKGDRERCLQAGMDAYVAKPIRAEELFDTIDALCSTRPHSTGAELLDEPDAVNWEQALEIVGGDSEVLKAITEAALTEIPQLMDATRAAVAGGDAGKLRLAAHTLKGTLRCFGASRSQEHARRLEARAQEGNLQQVQTVLADLEVEIAPVIAALSAFLREPAEQ